MTSIKLSFGAVVVLVVALLGIKPAAGVLEIDITQGVTAGVPIAIVPFGYRGSEPPPYKVSAIVEADLRRSGRFRTIAQQNFLSRPHRRAQVDFKDWRLIKAEALVIGQVTRIAADQYQIEFRLFDVFRGRMLGAYGYKVSASALRTVAHRISDFVYEALLGEPGAFNTQIAYVALRASGGERTYLLRVADSDGYNARTILQSPEPLISPAWSPDGQKLAYVSFEQGRSMVYIQRISDAKRTLVASYEGINSAPAWSPNGRTLAFTTSRDGNPEIYLLDLRSRATARITRNPAIDTEAAWSPDGRHLVFTSSRSGRPQIYRVRRDGSNLERLTFEGNYNARASYDPDGQRLTLVTNQGDGQHIGVFYLKNHALQVLTSTDLDESPSFAPNGSMILYATQHDGRGVLGVVSSNGRVKQTLRLQSGDVREPVWSP